MSFLGGRDDEQWTCPPIVFGTERSTRLIDFTNFHEATCANFVAAEIPDREPDFVSPSRSVYWDLDDGVVRNSDHWGPVNRSYWLYEGHRVLHRVVTGYCEYSEFHSVWTRRNWFFLQWNRVTP